MAVAVDVSKSKLRKEVLLKRQEIKNKELKDEKITLKLLEHEYIKKSQNILVYLSKDGEVNTFPLIDSLLKLGKIVYAPRVEGNIIKFYELTSLSDLKLGKFRVLEPISHNLFLNSKNSCIIVPGLLFDLKNYRLGYGGGYYDKYLQNKNIYKIGICYECFQISKLEVLEHDIKMDEVITER